MIQNEKVNIYYGSKDAYDFEKQNKRIDENDGFNSLSETETDVLM